MSHLLQPLEGTLPLRNRLVMPPMATWKGGEDGTIGQPVYDYYEDRARGDHFGLIIIEHCYVLKQGKYRVSQPGIDRDEMIPQFAHLAEVIHRHGPKTMMQINHSAGAASSEITGMEVVGPSNVPTPNALGADIPRPLTTDEIRAIVAAFGAAAARVKAAGFDGVEIHAAHGYILSQFLSPITNKRTDEYGGSLENRMRMHLEVIAAVRDAVGPDFPVFIRLGASDYMEGGTTMEDATVAAAAFERAGVNAIDVSGALCGYQRPDHKEQGYFAELSSAIKRVVSVPVILTGGITDLAVAEQLLAEGTADLIGVGRPVLKDPNWAAQALEAFRG